MGYRWVYMGYIGGLYTGDFTPVGGYIWVK